MALRVAIAPTRVLSFQINPPSINAGSTWTGTTTIKGLSTRSAVLVFAPNLESGLVITNAHVPSRDTLSIRIANVTANAIDPANQTMFAVVF